MKRRLLKSVKEGDDEYDSDLNWTDITESKDAITAIKKYGDTIKTKQKKRKK